MNLLITIDGGEEGGLPREDHLTTLSSFFYDDEEGGWTAYLLVCALFVQFLYHRPSFLFYN